MKDFSLHCVRDESILGNGALIMLINTQRAIMMKRGSGGRGCADETDLLSSLLAAVPHHESTRKALPSTKMH